MCRNGLCCPFRRMGTCFYYHPSEEETGGGCQVTLLKYCTLEPRAAADYGELLGSWARRTQPHTLIVHDPYLCALDRTGPMFDYLDRLPDEELSQAIDDLGLGGHTFCGCYPRGARSDQLPHGQPHLDSHAGQAPRARRCGVRPCPVAGVLHGEVGRPWHLG